jgi:hypothetical protein
MLLGARNVRGLRAGLTRTRRQRRTPNKLFAMSRTFSLIFHFIKNAQRFSRWAGGDGFHG